MKLYSQRFFGLFRCSRIYLLAFAVLIGVFDQSLTAYAAPVSMREGSVLGYYQFGPKFSYNASINSPGLAGFGGAYDTSVVIDDYSGVVDVRIPLQIYNSNGNIFNNSGLYKLGSNNVGNIYMDVAPSYIVSSGTSFGHFSLQSFRIEDANGNMLGRIIGEDLNVNGVPSLSNSKEVFTDVSQYGLNSCRYRFNYSFFDSSLYFFASNSEQLYLHVVFDCKTLYQAPSLKLTFDFSGVKFNGTGDFISEAQQANQVAELDNTIKEFHQEEVDSSNSAGDKLGSTLNDVTGTLSSIEILKLPWTMLTDLFNSIQGDGQTILTFPSFTLMGETLWPEYTFDLKTLDSNFDVLFKSVRLVSGILLCLAFSSYVRHFFERVFGNKESEEDV